FTPKIQPTPTSTPFPYTTLFRSGRKPTTVEIEEGRAYKQHLQDLEPQLKKIEETFRDLMYQVPNPPADDVPIGKDESENVEVKTDRKSTRLNSSHVSISYAVFCL